MKPSTPYSEALKRLRRFVEMSDAKPISQREDRIYGIHAGTEWEAEVRLSDIRAIVAAAVSEQQRWIPVSERLPEAGDEVFCWWGGSAFVGYLGDDGWMESGVGKALVPTHWLPMPAQPAERNRT